MPAPIDPRTSLTGELLLLLAGLAALGALAASGDISVREFPDLNERVGDRSGNRIAEPVSTDPGAACNQVYPLVMRTQGWGKKRGWPDIASERWISASHCGSM